MAFKLQAVLENNLVALRPLLPSDKEALYQVAKDPEIWAQHPKSDRYKKEVFDLLFEDAIASKGAMAIIDQSTHKMIGSTRFRQLEKETAVEIGWTFLSRSHWGGQFNSSIKSLMINYAFKYKDIIILYIDAKNIRSQTAALKIGATRIGKEDDPILFRDKIDYQTYRVLKSEWIN